MSAEVDSNVQLDLDQVAFLCQLEQQIYQDMNEVRTYERMEMSAGVAISPADSSRAGEPEIAGQTINISRGGCMVAVSTPPKVGDHYRVQIEGAGKRPLLTFARCVRAALSKDGDFEAGFQFFTPLELTDFPTTL